jgi:hypothetical protein
MISFNSVCLGFTGHHIRVNRQRPPLFGMYKIYYHAEPQRQMSGTIRNDVQHYLDPFILKT